LNNQVVYSDTGEFGAYLGLKFKVDEAGKISFVGEDSNYVNSWEKLEAVSNYPQVVDQFWPGPLPSIKGALNINVKFDKFPEHVKWTFAKRGTDGAYTDVTSFDGAIDGITNDLVVTEMLAGQLGEGWYRLKITDSSGDGICCSFRRGWATVTGYLMATRKAGMVWGSNGEFGGGLEIYINMNAKGFVVRTTDNPSIVA
jgi:hypothetical protein